MFSRSTGASRIFLISSATASLNSAELRSVERAGAPVPTFWLSFDDSAVLVPAAERGCAFLHPSRYTATAFSPFFHACRYASAISSTDALSGRFTVFEIAPEMNGCVAAIISRCPM